MRPFVHLHCHSQYSLLDGISRLEEMLQKAKDNNMPALALTDHGNMYGAINFYKLAKSYGIKPILGCEVYVTKNEMEARPGKGERLYHLVLLAATNEGYANLVKIVSKAATEGFYNKPRVSHQCLRQYSAGLIALTACIQGEVPQAILSGDMEEARNLIEWYIDTYGKDNFFLEIQDHNQPEELQVQEAFEVLSKEYGLGLVATNDFHYVEQADSDAHDIKLCISTGKRRSDRDRLRFPNDEFYMKTGNEMEKLFAANEEAIENTLRIADRCNVELDFSTHHLPHYEVPEGETAQSYLRKICEERIASRYGALFPELEARLDFELKTINDMGFNDYFLIVWDYIDFSQKQGIYVGPGRGSAAGSVVAYLLGITGLDPLRYNLLFERFLNPERISMPDIDIDFCYERRGEVIEYVTKKYGAHCVSQIITFGTEAARAVIRDVGRVMDIPLAEVNRIVKFIPPTVGITLKEALTHPELKLLYDEDATVHELFDLSFQLEGIVRNSSTHAAGVVIAAQPLEENVPIQRSPEGGTITQYDKDNVESLGLLKMDFLGLRTLTVMDIALQLIKENRGITFDINRIPLDDEATCNILTRGDTMGVFQLESAGITSLAKTMGIHRFEDLIHLVALYRPGPLNSGMVDDFINCRHGDKAITYLDDSLKPILEPILKDTFGVILYQEQVMQIASAMGGFTLGEADILRRAMGKKKEKDILQQRDKFIAGSVANGYNERLAQAMFDLILHFAGYGFNKSHSAAYGYIAYQTAYLKAHYFPEFLAATMTSFINRFDKLPKYIDECRRHNVPVLGPSINHSAKTFIVEGDAIRFGLSGIKNLGDKPVEAIIEEREVNGPYVSLEDFCKRISPSAVNKRTLEALIRCGAFDEFPQNRRQLLLAYENVQALGATHQREVATGSMNLFADHMEDVAFTYPQAEELSMEEKLSDEKTYIGYYTSGHPLKAYEKELKELFSLGQLADEGEHYDGKSIIFGGLLEERVDRLTKRNERMAILTVEDFSGSVNVVAFPKVFQKCQHLLNTNQPLKIKGRIDSDDRGVQIIADSIGSLRETYDDVRAITLVIDRLHDSKAISETLMGLLARFEGHVPVTLYVESTKKKIPVKEALYFQPTEETCQQLRELLGEEAIRFTK